MPNPSIEASGRSCIARYMEKPVEARGEYGWGRVLLAFTLLLLGCAVLTVAISTGLAIFTQGADSTVTPVFTVLQFAAIAVWIPVVWVVARFVVGMRMGDVASCVGRMRWGVLARATAISVAALGIYYVATVVMSGASLVPLSGGVIAGVLLAIVLMPLQAAAEEYVFRGLGPQIILGRTGYSIARFAVVSVVFSIIFASLHGSKDLTTWFIYLVFGVIFATLTFVTGGIEAPIALHAVNNVLFTVTGILRGTDLAAQQTDVGTDLAVVIQVLVMVGASVIVAVVERRRGRASEFEA